MEFRKLLDVSIINDKTVNEFQKTKMYVATGDVEYNKIINFEEVTYKSKPSRANRTVEIGDILVAKMKETLKVLKVTKEDCDRYIFSTGFSTLKAKEDILDNNYFYRVLISELFQKQKDKYSKGATQKAINNTGLKKIKIPVPPINIQKQIVEILDEAESLIDTRKEQIKLLDNLVESIFYNMFGDPTINDKGWKVDKLDNYINVMGGYAFKSKEYVEEGIPIIKIGNINRGYFESKNLCYYKRIKRLDGFIVQGGDLVMSLTGTVGKDDYGNVCILDDSYEEYYLNQRNAKIEILINLNKYYLTFLLRNKGIKQNLVKVDRGVRQANISNSDIKKLEVPIPPIQLQNQFAEKVELIESQKQLLQDSLNLLEDNYNSLMQRAFKGELF